ncbi:hypothetical protein, partial [Bradyrhizobium ottawaense]|uniref:hypothetical protein n=1 Tax=Bradyrhizobium ottawaense TaxID=931866 RepID=UPI0030C6D16D
VHRPAADPGDGGDLAGLRVQTLSNCTRGRRRDQRAGIFRIKPYPMVCSAGNVSSSQMLTFETAPVRK